LQGSTGPADEWATPGNVADWRGAKGLFEDVSRRMRARRATRVDPMVALRAE
jgi:hypothetical protein